MQRLFSLLFLIFLIGCAGSRRATYFSKTIENQINNSPVLSTGHTGFLLADAQTGVKIFGKNETKYFTPASNTKILTLFACLQFLGDSLPGVQFFREKDEENDDVLIFQGTGDPTFLHPNFAAWQPIFSFLKNSKDKLVMVSDPTGEPRFGRGWAWDDYNYAFQPEKSAFPIYGNCVRLSSRGAGFEVQPPVFKDHFFYPVMAKNVEKVERLENENLWGMNQLPEPGKEKTLPIYRPAANELLADTLKKAVDFSKLEPDEKPTWQTIFSCPTDTALRRMMHQSDNLLAEQLVLMCAREKFGRLESEPMLDFLRDSMLAFLPQKLKWVDGSGLSRYNLTTSANISEILRQLFLKQSRQRLFSFFPAGGVAGTLEKNYGGTAGKPYVFAKSGSMSGVYCLSGFLVAKSGKVLVFSFMHNGFLGSNLPVREELQQILEKIRDKF